MMLCIMELSVYWDGFQQFKFLFTILKCPFWAINNKFATHVEANLFGGKCVVWTVGMLDALPVQKEMMHNLP